MLSTPAQNRTCGFPAYGSHLTIGYEAWIEDMNGKEIEESVLKNAIKVAPLGPADMHSSGDEVDVIPPATTIRAPARSARHH